MEDDDEWEAILNFCKNWTTLGTLQYLSCLIVGQFGVIVSAKIRFNEAITTSNKQYC